MLDTIDRYEAQLEHQIRDLLKGQSLKKWIYDISKNFLLDTSQSNPPFSIVKYLPYRRIRAFHDDNIPVGGQLEPTNDGFIIKLNPQKLKNERYYNLVLAHEVAHSFFYDINSPQPVEISGLAVGSQGLEYLCNKIARYLVIPHQSIEKELINVNEKAVDVQFIYKLAIKYDVGLKTLLVRTIIDEALLPGFFFQFKLDPEKNNWRLVSIYKPRYASSIFTPRLEKPVYASSKLQKFFNDVFDKVIKDNNYFTKKIPLKEFGYYPLSGFTSKLISNDSMYCHFSWNPDDSLMNLFLIEADAFQKYSGEKTV